MIKDLVQIRAHLELKNSRQEVIIASYYFDEGWSVLLPEMQGLVEYCQRKQLPLLV